MGAAIGSVTTPAPRRYSRAFVPSRVHNRHSASATRARASAQVATTVAWTRSRCHCQPICPLLFARNSLARGDPHVGSQTFGGPWRGRENPDKCFLVFRLGPSLTPTIMAEH